MKVAGEGGGKEKTSGFFIHFLCVDDKNVIELVLEGLQEFGYNCSCYCTTFLVKDVVQCACVSSLDCLVYMLLIFR